MGVHGVKAVFFDLDNTLVDTAAAGRRAIEEVLPVSLRGPPIGGLRPWALLARRQRRRASPTPGRRGVGGLSGAVNGRGAVRCWERGGCRVPGSVRAAR